jgi:hypothetical protein
LSVAHTRGSLFVYVPAAPIMALVNDYLKRHPPSCIVCRYVRCLSCCRFTNHGTVNNGGIS